MAFIERFGKHSIPERELETLKYWEKERIYDQVVESTKNGPLFTFYEGPPTANGKPGIHHVLSRVYKDIYIRFKTMQGFHVPRKAGWDCHGLPVEREVEKELGISTKSEIEEKYGVEKFNELCRKSVQTYIDHWNAFSKRLAFWIDYKDAYYTLDNNYIESVWSLLKIIWEKGLIYQGYKVVPFDPVMGATMSDAEVNLGYKTVMDPSLTVKFPITGESDTYFLVWTTTPWTLPSNVALALNPKEDYVTIEFEAAEENSKTDISIVVGEKLVLAKALAESLLGDKKYKIIDSKKGKDWENTEYDALYRFFEIEKGKSAYKTVCADFVTMDSGTGIVHIAPAYGADDLEVGQKHSLPVLHAVALDGKFIESTPWKGTFFKDADKEIIRDLKQRKQVFKSEQYKHEYPFGWRTGAPLLYYAKDAWYIRTTEVRAQLIKNNQSINWIPETIKEGRFGNWLENNRDWALSRERYWGTPFPVWTDGENFQIIGSVKELEKLTGKSLSKLDLHRPYIDKITFEDKEGKTWKRVPEVIDAWFDSGSMPFAQWGWPNTGKKEFETYFPADFISEAIDQTRGWFYTLLAVSTMVKETSSYKNVICLGHVLDEKGEKMSKSKGNTVSPDEVFEAFGADAVRWYFLTGAAPGNSRRISKPGRPNDPLSLVSGFFNTIRNSVSFFVLYANIDKIEYTGDLDAPIKGAPVFKDRPPIDRWILSRLHSLVDEVTKSLEKYDSQSAGEKIEEFTEALSNWYIRRNRRRFWKGELDSEKLAAYDTLWLCLVNLARLMAPFTPYLSEDVFLALLPEGGHAKVSQTSAKKSVGKKQSASVGKTAAKPKKSETNTITESVPSPHLSVHLATWPKTNSLELDNAALKEGDLILHAAELGRSARQESGIKIRQPLGKVMVHASKEERKVLQANSEILLEELNVKELEFLDDAAGLLDYRVKPNLPVLGKKLGNRVKDVQGFIQNLKDVRSFAIDIRNGKSVNAIDEIVLTPEDILIESVSKSGTAGAEGYGLLVVIDTTLSEDLIREGWVRDIVRNIQELRKKVGLSVTDRIILNAEGDSELMQAIEQFKSYIENETLGQLDLERSSEFLGETTIQLDKKSVVLRIRK